MESCQHLRSTTGRVDETAALQTQRSRAKGNDGILVAIRQPAIAPKLRSQFERVGICAVDRSATRAVSLWV